MIASTRAASDTWSNMIQIHHSVFVSAILSYWFLIGANIWDRTVLKHWALCCGVASSLPDCFVTWFLTNQRFKPGEPIDCVARSHCRQSWCPLLSHLCSDPLSAFSDHSETLVTSLCFEIIRLEKLSLKFFFSSGRPISEESISLVLFS